MIHRTDKKLISEALWEVVRLDDGSTGLRMLGVGSGLEGEDTLTQAEALELRDYINKHLGSDAHKPHPTHGTETTTNPTHQEEYNPLPPLP